VVAHGGAHTADAPTVELHRTPRVRQLAVRPVEVQQHQPARRPAQVVHPRDGLLAAVAALVQVHRGRQPAHLVREGAVVGVEPQTRDARRHPQRLVRLHTGDRTVEGRQLGARQQAWRRVGDHGVLRRHVRHLDAEHEAHPVQEGQQLRRRPRLDVRQDGLAVVDQVQVVLDVALRRQDQRLRGHAGLQGGDVLREQVVQPAQPVRAGDAQDAAVRQVDQSGLPARGLRCSAYGSP
jgi:hypothetical protein